MSTFAQEIIDAIKQHDLENDFFHSEVECDDTELTAFNNALPDVTFNQAECHGGEGEGSQFWTVYEFTRNNEKVFIKFDGWYASYVGSEFDSMFQVEPREVMRVEYFQI